MTTRRRVSDNDVKVPTSTKEASVVPAAPADAEPKIRSPQWMKILCFSLLFFIPYFYLLLFHYEIDRELKRSILINAILSAGGFIFTLRLIPVASRYVLRHNLFGYDINKKGTPRDRSRYQSLLVLLLESSSWYWQSCFSISTSQKIPIGLSSTMLH